MTRDEVIRLAREVDAVAWNSDVGYGSGEWVVVADIDVLVRFAALVAAKEREECARVCEMPIDIIQHTDDISETIYGDWMDCAEAIRARGAK